MHVAIWDLDDTLYHRHVQVGDDYSGTHDIVLFPDALPALTKPDQIDILVTKESREGVQGVKLDALGIRERFEEIHTVRRDEDKREVFASIRERFALPIYVIGDRVDSEILYGNELGMMTILCPRGKYLFRKPGSEVEREFYAEVPIDVEFIGKYHEAGVFLDRLAKLPRIVNVTYLKMSVANDREASPELAVKGVATTFRFLEQKNEPAKPGKKPGAKPGAKPPKGA